MSAHTAPEPENEASPTPAPERPAARDEVVTHAHLSGEPHLHAEHFALSSEVAHLPLARRRQRLGAMLVDLALVGVVASVFRSPSLLVGVVGGTLLYWASGKTWAPAWMHEKVARAGLAVVLCIALIVAGRVLKPPRQAHAGETAGEQVKAGMGLDGLGLSGPDLLRLATTEDRAKAQAMAAKVAGALEANPRGSETARELVEVLAEPELPLSKVAREELLRALTPVAGVVTETAPDPRDARIAALQLHNDTLTAEVARQQKELESRHGLLHFLASTVKDFGIGVGWSYLYFIAFLVVWRGHTPGKRLFGIRVVRVDGKPMTWWRSWERFHGYAASMITGLLGFAQILWDPSRQCLHDKVAETVVVQERHHRPGR